MSKQSRVVIVSAALVAALSGIAQAGTVHHRSPGASAMRPSVEAILHRLPDQNIYGMAIEKPQTSCVDITCPGFALIGIGF